MVKKFIRAAVVVLIPIICLAGLQRLLVPKYVENIPEGSMIEEYYRSGKGNDIIFIGDCEVYENISPVTMWEEYGITSYVRGSADQYIWQSYYLLEDTLKYEIPKAVVVSILSVRNDEADNEAYNRMTIDGMKWSTSKINAIRSSMTDEETFASYIFPILRYHSRWNELTDEDFKYFFNKPYVTTKGYLMQVGVRQVTTVPRAPVLPDYTFSEKNMDYLKKMKELCDKKGVELVFFKAPSIYPHWYDEYDSQIVEFAEKNNIMYINALKDIYEIGIDFTTDTFDYGQHLNVQGAEKLSKYLGKVLDNKYNLDDHRNDAEISKEWEAVAGKYYSEKEAKIREWEESND